jgi:hypothetical protein
MRSPILPTVETLGKFGRGNAVTSSKEFNMACREKYFGIGKDLFQFVINIDGKDY